MAQYPSRKHNGIADALSWIGGEKADAPEFYRQNDKGKRIGSRLQTIGKFLYINTDLAIVPEAAKNDYK